MKHWWKPYSNLGSRVKAETTRIITSKMYERRGFSGYISFCLCGCGLQLKSKADYASGHNPESHKLSKNKREEKKRKCSKSTKQRWDENRELMLQGSRKCGKTLKKKYRTDKVYAEFVREKNASSQTPEVRAIISRKAKERWADPEYKARVSKVMSDQFALGGRKPHPRKNRFHTGWIETKKAGRIYYRSGWEKSFIEILECSSAVKKFSYETISIQYRFKGKVHTYFPDFLVEVKNGLKYLVEIKSERFKDAARTKAKFKAAKEFCSARGIEFKTFFDQVESISCLVN